LKLFLVFAPMLSATCTECGTAGQFMPFLAGQRVKCKACPKGWVQLPPPDFVPLPKLPPVATLIPPPKAKLVEPSPGGPPQAHRAADAPPPPEWKRKHADQPVQPDDPVQPDPPGGPAIPPELTDSPTAPNWLRNFGGLLLVLGLGSVVLFFFGLQFRILAWLEPHQPFAGFIMAGVGAVMVLLFILLRR
jgi:hypothetical protein